MRRDLGDFQTPPALVAAVLDALGPIGARWTRVLEPSCGCGHFLAGLLARDVPPREIVAVEVQEPHARSARALASAEGPARVEVIRANLFDLDLRRDVNWRERGPLLVIGNPPWVTSAELGVLEGEALAPKRNVKGLGGLEARTGAANFDLAEAVWIKLITELAEERPTIALLCKTSVARSVLELAVRRDWPVAEASIHAIDASAWFGASVEACLFRLQIGHGPRLDRVPVFANLLARTPATEWGFAHGRLVADRVAYRSSMFADGTAPIEWRQGLKHDAASVMELARADDGSLQNKHGALVQVEDEHVFPLLKGADLARPTAATRDRAVIVTQRRLGDDTDRLESEAPRLWAYLRAHADVFNRRKSSIYRGQPSFALFGIGPYSFAPYKVAVSGLHRPPRFRAVGPVGGRPVMLDDTCYFLPCASAAEAALVTALLHEPPALGLIEALTFSGAKRPITKAVLQRIDLAAILARAERATFLARADRVLERDLAGSAADREQLRQPDFEEPRWPSPRSITTASH